MVEAGTVTPLPALAPFATAGFLQLALILEEVPSLTATGYVHSHD